MPEYLFYTVDENGEPEEIVGVQDGPNSREALEELYNEVDPFFVFDDDQPRAVRVGDELSRPEIEHGVV